MLSLVPGEQHPFIFISLLFLCACMVGEMRAEMSLRFLHPYLLIFLMAREIIEVGFFSVQF